MSDSPASPSDVPNISGGAYLEWLWQEWHSDPGRVSERWQKIFTQWSYSSGEPIPQSTSSKDVSTAYLGEDRHEETHRDRLTKIEALTHAYRRFGHLSAHLNPLDESPPELAPYLTLEHHGLAEAPRDEALYLTHFSTEPLSIQDILAALQKTYTSRFGADFQDLYSAEQVKWLQQRMESQQNRPELSAEDRQKTLHLLARAEGFERFLHKRYLGQKRFSVEGLDVLIPVLHMLVEEGAAGLGVEELCLGMAHRGRLNVLVNFMGKPPREIFESFEGSEFNHFDIDGDVKYHLGYAREHITASHQKVRLYLAPNPSHLEAVNPVIQGFVKARQHILEEKIFEQKSTSGSGPYRTNPQKKIIPVLLHGDGAFVGQGIVAETLNLSQLGEYSTGGTVHIILNNQVGFTTNPDEARSCYYASDIAKFVQAPVFHVNADDPDSCVWAAKLALHYRQTFHRDVVIDLVGYRRHGHNEGDEPAFTQPLMYQKIKTHRTCYQKYLDFLVALEQEQDSSSEADLRTSLKNHFTDYSDKLQKIYEEVRNGNEEFQPGETHKDSNEHPDTAKDKSLNHVPDAYSEILNPPKMDFSNFFAPVKTSVSRKELQDALRTLTTYPDSFTPHHKVTKVLKRRASMLGELGDEQPKGQETKKGTDDGAVDWATAELLALATLASSGHPIRLTGQDVRRGTFSSRHGVIVDKKTGKAHAFLGDPSVRTQSLDDSWARVDMINSPLSEQGCLGFEYGYAVALPRALVLWEAQFGDFSNGAQIIVDQFLVASEAKWQQVASLVMLLPHGYEGQGPEHSNARPERYLQLCGGGNIQVVNCSTPAQHFHVLRRQALRPFRKCLICMTPKSLLRDPEALSSVAAFTDHAFSEVLDDPETMEPTQITRLIFCSGKIYYEAKRHNIFSERHHGRAVIRIEQLYPFPQAAIETIKKRYTQAREVVWMQEEPQNMGAWSFLRPHLESIFPDHQIVYVGRKTSGSTAEGSQKAHLAEQERIISQSVAMPQSKLLLKPESQS